MLSFIGNYAPFTHAPGNIKSQVFAEGASGQEAESESLLIASEHVLWDPRLPAALLVRYLRCQPDARALHGVLLDSWVRAAAGDEGQHSCSCGCWQWPQGEERHGPAQSVMAVGAQGTSAGLGR